jgi:hypothetical protein
MTRIAAALAWLATGLAAVASAVGLLTTVYRDAPAMTDQARGADLATLLVAVPLLVVAMWRARDGSPFARMTVAGALAYLIYTYTIFAFQVVFNALTPVYIAILGAAAWALATGLPDLVRAVTDGVSQPRLPRRTTAGFLALIALAFAAMWLGQIGQAIVSGGPPEAVVDLNLPTSGVYALDLAFVLPVLAMASVLLARRDVGGRWIAYGSLVFSVLMALSIVGALAMVAIRGALGDPSTLIGFALITGLAIVLTLAGTRPARSQLSTTAGSPVAARTRPIFLVPNHTKGR